MDCFASKRRSDRLLAQHSTRDRFSSAGAIALPHQAMLISEFPIPPQIEDRFQKRYEWWRVDRRLTIYADRNEYFRTHPTGEIESGVIDEGESLEGLFTWLTTPQPIIQDQPLPRASSYPHIHDIVAVDVGGRKAIGIERYGKPLQPFNGRKAMVDLYQELLDASVYCRQEMFEREELLKFVDEAIAAYHSGKWDELGVAIGQLQELREAQKQ